MRERGAAVAVTLTAVVLSIKTTARNRGGKATWLEARNFSGSEKVDADFLFERLRVAPMKVFLFCPLHV